MGNLWIQETFENATTEVVFGESRPYETYCETRGELYRDLRGEYGRCISKVYVDRGAEVIPVGWVFQKRMQYEDSPEYYLRNVWVTVHPSPDEEE